jgi:hypothetical protein
LHGIVGTERPRRRPTTAAPSPPPEPGFPPFGTTNRIKSNLHFAQLQLL